MGNDISGSVGLKRVPREELVSKKVIKRIKQSFRRSWLSCERYSERASCRLDAPLSFRDEIGYRFHHALCHTCRSVAKHWVKMQSQLKEFATDFGQLESVVLSDQKVAEITKQLEKIR